MTAHLPPALLALFAPRPPIPSIAEPEKKPAPPLTGLAAYLSRFETNPPAPKQQETKAQKRERIKQERTEKAKAILEARIANWNPSADPNATADPTRTLFVGRLNYNTSEHKLKREFEIYGSIKKVRVVCDKEGRPRGYAFIEFEKEKDAKTAHRSADGKKIDGRRVLVDMEHGRLNRNWRPRVLGGGLGYTRKGGEDVNQKYSGREQSASEGHAAEETARSRDRSRSREREASSRPRDRERDRDRGHREGHRQDRGRDRDFGSRDRGTRDRDHGGDRGDRDHRDRKSSYHSSGSRRERSRSRDRKDRG